MSFVPAPCSASDGTLDCTTDSITVCPPASGVFDVHVVGCQGPATVTQVAASVTTVNIVLADSDRCSLIIFNDSTSTLRIRFGAGAAANDYTLQIPGNGSYIMDPPAPYTGLITGIWETANGNAHVTEVT